MYTQKRKHRGEMRRDADAGWLSRRCTIQSREHRACRVWRSPMPMSIRTHSVGYGDTESSTWCGFEMRSFGVTRSRTTIYTIK
ncbi:hypothetical protein KQX54_016462 [Cotesia glomerata]|uniref:Uncharacterized protein n=1 Tax=Cotesia glomerata TaxID=32391 RepID=A0AAV7HVP5_COTGL|nr:hypothetical protein KQX54_016462 [Cotesia glomerata]